MARPTTDEERFEAGRARVEALRGRARATAAAAEMMRHTMTHLFGDVWQGEELSLQERSLATCATLVALAREAEQRLHFRGARNLGIERDEARGAHRPRRPLRGLARSRSVPCARSTRCGRRWTRSAAERRRRGRSLGHSAARQDVGEVLPVAARRGPRWPWYFDPLAPLPYGFSAGSSSA
jgi:4-carboxymuconolactone decarboxylase